MTIGHLKHRITLQKLITTTNENGFSEESYVDYKEVWASIRNLYGKEFYEAAAVQKEMTVKFIIRVTSDLDETMRILFKGKIYNITSIDNIRYENKYIEIKTLEVGLSG